MKIAFLNLYSGINERGAEAFTHELGNRLKKQHKVVFFQAGKKAFDQQMNVTIIEGQVLQPQSSLPKGLIPQLEKYLFLDPGNRSVLAFTQKAIHRILEGKFDVVIPLNGFWQVLLLKLFQPWGRYKILTTGHSGPGWDERWNLYLKPNRFIATTGPAFAWAKTIAPWTKVELIPYAVDERLFATAAPFALDLPRPRILCPAALVPYKRIDLAIKAVARLPQGSLVILGKGKLLEELTQLGKKLLPNRFEIMSVPYHQMPAYYKASDLVTLPSSPQENSPMVFLESLAAGKLVVTTDTPRNRWMLEEAGLYVEPEDEPSYAKALQMALQPANEIETRQHIDKALQKFRWEEVLLRYNQVIGEMLKNWRERDQKD